MSAADIPKDVAGGADAPVVLITGASSGIGHAPARRFAARGWRVWASMRRPEKGEALRLEARERGWALQTPALDVTDDGSVSRAVEQLLGGVGSALRHLPQLARRQADVVGDARDFVIVAGGKSRIALAN